MSNSDYPEEENATENKSKFTLLVPRDLDCSIFQQDGEKHDVATKVRSHAVHRRMRRKEIFQNVIASFQKDKELRAATCSNDITTVETLLAEGTDVNKSDDKLRTPLHFAASKGNDRIVRLLLDAGADPNKQDINGNTALHVAACTNHIAVVTTLLTAGTNAKTLDKFGQSPLQLALSHLKLLRGDSNRTAETLKANIQQIVNMIQAFLKRSRGGGGGESVVGKMEELDELSSRIPCCSTLEELDVVNDMLTSFTSLAITYKTYPSVEEAMTSSTRSGHS